MTGSAKQSIFFWATLDQVGMDCFEAHAPRNDADKITIAIKKITIAIKKGTPQ
jgi:hypothetical protein